VYVNKSDIGKRELASQHMEVEHMEVDLYLLYHNFSDVSVI